MIYAERFIEFVDCLDDEVMLLDLNSGTDYSSLMDVDMKIQ